jgi:arginyl-tRNA synthetase
MIDAKNTWKQKIADSLNKLIEKNGLDSQTIEAEEIALSVPPKPEMGDLAFAVFPYAKIFRTAPPKIAEMLVEELSSEAEADVQAEGAYVNIRINLAGGAETLIEEILEKKEAYGHSKHMEGRKIMIEFSCPNTNKPLHLGHLRNNSLGESVSRILAAVSADVQKVNLINDRGVHICKSMLAYIKEGNNTDPEKSGIKGDHLVGDFYVKYDQMAKDNPEVEEEARELLRKWEAGDPETVALWKKMNHWTISGIEETYKKTGITFDKVYFEHQTYKKGKDKVLKGLEDGVFYKEDDGSIWIDLSDIKLDKRVLLRKDGTSLYVTQDIGTAIDRHEDFPFDQLIYVVMSEQNYHFRVLFHILKRLGYSWAENLYHLSYGMVHLPEGRMKSREGTVVDADDLIAELEKLAKQEIIDKGRETEVDDVDQTAADVALGALHYFLLQVNPGRDMIFNPADSLSFSGNTGPYIQYMGARISSMLDKYDESTYAEAEFKAELLDSEQERELMKLLSAFPEQVVQAADQHNPAVIVSFLYELAKTFSRFYHDIPILRNDDKNLVKTRIELSKAVLQVIQNACYLLNIPFLDKM